MNRLFEHQQEGGAGGWVLAGWPEEFCQCCLWHCIQIALPKPQVCSVVENQQKPVCEQTPALLPLLYKPQIPSLGLLKGDFGELWSCCCLQKNSLKPKLDLDQHRAQDCQSLPVSYVQNKAIAMFRGEGLLFTIPYGFTLLFILLPFLTIDRYK